MLLRLTLLLCSIATLASAQLQPHFGLMAGVPLNDTLISSEYGSTTSTNASFDRFHSKTKRLLIGPSFRLDLPRGLGLEFDTLWQRLNSDETKQSSFPPSSAIYSFGQTTANRWQFPLLVQYAHALPLSKARAFVEFGPSVSHIGDGRTTVRSAVTAPSSSAAGSTTSVSSFTSQGGTQAGVTAGAGIDVTMLHLHLRPQFRYSHWFSTNAASPAGFVSFTLTGVASGFVPNPIASTLGVILPFSSQSNLTHPNEVAFLLDILF